MSEKTWHLKRCDLFERLTPGQLSRLESHCRMRKFPRKTLIYLPADHADGVLLLASGRAKISALTEDGKQAILAFIEPGELFGELAVVDSGVREEYAETCEPSVVILIAAEQVRRLMQEYPHISIGVTKLIGLRRRRIERRLKSLLFRSNRQRLVHLLLELAEQYGIPSKEGIRLGIKLSHQDLASVIGSTRETVTITLGELQAEGHLRVGRQKIVLTDPRQLAQSVHVRPPEFLADGQLGSHLAPRDEAHLAERDGYFGRSRRPS